MDRSAAELSPNKYSILLRTSRLNILATDLSVGESCKASSIVICAFILAVFGCIHMCAMLENPGCNKQQDM